jgi:hypothetical protein
MQGAELCEVREVVVKEPAADFKPADAISSIKPSELAGMGSMDALVTGIGCATQS